MNIWKLAIVVAVAANGTVLAGDLFCSSTPNRCPTSTSTPRRMPVYGSVYRREVQPLPTQVQNYWHAGCTPRRSVLPKQQDAAFRNLTNHRVQHSYCPVCENYQPAETRDYHRGAYCPSSDCGERLR